MAQDPITTNELIIKVSSLDDTALKNTSTATNAITIGGTATTQAGATNIGIGSQAISGGYSVALGINSIVRGNGVSIGKEAQQTGGAFCVTVGSETKTGAFSSATALGAKASAQNYGAIQLGQGINSEAESLYVGFSNSSGTATNNYKMLDSTGQIPGTRMALQGAGAPTTATAGSVGQFYVDTTNQNAYICVSDASSTYTWKQITS